MHVANHSDKIGPSSSTSEYVEYQRKYTPERGDITKFIQRLPKPQYFRINVLSMGECNVGKSCLIKRYCEKKFFSRYIGTIGIDYGVKKVNLDSTEVRVNFWDLSGHPEFFEVRNEFYKDAQGVILVYDVCSKKSFDALDDWLSECMRYSNSNESRGGRIIMILCANKIDGQSRVIPERDGREWAAKNGMLYFETSAKTGENVDDMLETLFREILAISNE